MRVFLMMICSAFSMALIGQSWEATITDAQSGAPIPFANIGIVGKDIGTVSDEFGRFKLNLGQAQYSGDTLRCSTIGYCSKDFLLAANTPLPSVCALEVCSALLPEVQVVSRNFKQQKTLGHTTASKKIVFYFMSNKLGTELATKIEVKKAPLSLINANFNIAENKFGEVFFRVNIYDFDPDTNLPGKNLLPQEVIVKATKSSETLSVDLRPYNIVVERDFILSLEWIKALNGGKITEDLKFCAALSSKGGIFIKKTSQSKWKAFEEKKMGFKAGIAFYVDVKY